MQQQSITLQSGEITALTGLSGSGKTTLLFDILAPSFRQNRPIHCKKTIKSEKIGEIVTSERKFTLSGGFLYTFLELATPIRKLLTAGQKAFTSSSLSRRSKKGACTVCNGIGYEKITLDFLAESKTACEVCNGTGYNKKALSLLYFGKTIGDIEQLTLFEAIELFSNETQIYHILQKVCSAGLGHLKIGAETASLSHGEQIRLSLVRQLLQKQQTPTLYLLDEPTAGQNSSDIEHLYTLLDTLRKNGSSVLLSTHHPLMMELADRVISL